MANQFLLRRADITDVDALSKICQQTFRETFVEDLSIPYPENDLNDYFHSSGSPEIFAKKIHDPQQAIWVIEDTINKELVAYALVRPCNTDDLPHLDICSNKEGAISRLYVRRDRQGQGFGQQLMNVVLPWLEEQYPGRPIWLNVLSENTKAQKFYNRYGFNKAGEYYYSVGEWKDLEFIMKREAKTS